MKQRLLKLWPLSWAYRQGGIDSFPLASKDIWETMKDEVEKRGKDHAKVLLNDLLSPINWDAVVTVDSKRGIILVGGEQLDDSKLNNLKSEAEFFMASDLWKILGETPKALAERSMFIEGDSVDFLKKGRSMLYTLSSQQKVIDTFRNVSVK